MAPQIFVHFGLPKTGTSTLQAKMLPALLEAGFIDTYVGSSYPGGEKIMGAIRTIAREENRRAADFLQDWLNAQSGITFLSIEGPLFLPSRMQEGAAKRLGALFNRFSPNLLITLRQPEAFFRSLYQEVVKGDLYTDPLQFLGARPSLKYFQYPNWDVSDLSLDKLLGPYIENFEDVLLVNMKTLGSSGWLETFLGVNFNHAMRDRLEMLAGDAQNKSLGAHQVQSFERFNLLVRRLSTSSRSTDGGWRRWSDLPIGSRHSILRFTVFAKYWVASRMAARPRVSPAFELPTSILETIKKAQREGPITDFLSSSEDFRWIKA